jgi:hypothetical protein
MLQAADEPTATAIREWIESSVTAQEAALRLEAAQGQLTRFEEFREECDINPDGVAYDLVSDSPEAASRLVLSILTQNPTLYATLAPKLAALADPTKRAQTTLDVQREIQDADRLAQGRLAEQRAVRENLADIEVMLAAVVQDVDPKLQQRVYQDLRRDVGDYAGRRNLITLPLNQVMQVVAGRLTDLGLDPEASAARATGALAKRGGSTPAGRVAPRGPVVQVARQATPQPAQRTPPRPTVPTVKRDGAAFVASAGRRSAVPAIPTGGAGSPGQPAPLVAPRNADGSPMSIEQTTAWHRAEVAKGNRHY